MISWRARKVDSDKLLLKKCSEGDPAALDKFAGSSYVNEVLQTVRIELQNDYDSVTVDRIATICVVHIYSLWQDLPSLLSSLRRRIRKAAMAFAVEWRRRDLE